MEMFDYIGSGTVFFLILAIIGVAMARQAITIVPPDMAYVIERLGKYYATIGAGRYLLFPFVNNIAYRHSLDQQVLTVPEHTAISSDNISLLVNSELHLKVVNPYAASYCVGNYAQATTELAQTILRDEIGKVTLDMSIDMREDMSARMISVISEVVADWGIQVMRYNIKNIVKEE